MKKFNTIMTISIFAFILIFYSIIFITTPKKEYSISEKRLLEQAPNLSVESVLSGEYFSELETYFLDQFPYRDGFRKTKAIINNKILQKNDNNDLFNIGEHIFKIDYPLSISSTLKASEKINFITKNYLKGSDVYYSVIPDKNYFLRNEYDRLTYDYDEMMNILNDNIETASYIDIFDTLTLSDYYNTDLHIKQEKFFETRDKLYSEMNDGTLLPLSSKDEYSTQTLPKFYGTYHYQYALSSVHDELLYLTDDVVSNSTYTTVEDDLVHQVYDENPESLKDSYDIFLGGAKAIVEITNNNAKVNKELIMFRDSFASSLAPLMLSGYSKITLIDLRYIASDKLKDYVDFAGQDVLFLYNTSLINSAHILK